MINRVFVLIAVLSLFAPLPTNANEIDASTPVICATIDVNDCAPGAQCIAGVPEDVSVPRFFRINFAQKSIVVTRDDGTTLTTIIRSQSKLDGKLVLQGTEAGLGWSMAIISASGKMSPVAAGEDRGVVIFGACTAL